MLVQPNRLSLPDQFWKKHPYALPNIISNTCKQHKITEKNRSNFYQYVCYLSTSTLTQELNTLEGQITNAYYMTMQESLYDQRIPVCGIYLQFCMHCKSPCAVQNVLSFFLDPISCGSFTGQHFRHSLSVTPFLIICPSSAPRLSLS